MIKIFRKLISVVVIIVIAMLTKSAVGQVFGGHPPSQKWLQINTDSVRVIFPPGLTRQAKDIVAITRMLSNATAGTIGGGTKKISIILQNQTTSSNGYVGLGPWRSEFYLTPMQNNFRLGSLPWHKSLALHEYRHVQQFSNFRKGVSNVAYRLFGEQVLALLTNTAVPNYFWEGDAVYQETAMSGQGRGRLPYFHNGYRALWAADKNYSWKKLRNGSLRDYVPDHYQLGYLMVAYGRERYGDSLWARVTDDAVRFRGLFYPWQRAVKKYTGVSYPQFRTEALEYFREQLTESEADQDSPNLKSDSTKDELARFAAKQNHFAGDELYPQWVNAEEVVMVKSDYKNISAFVVKNVNTGKSSRIRIKDISEDQYFSYKNNRIVYAAYQPAARWGWRDYSDIKLVDVKTGRQKVITHRTKYFSPDISNDGKRIIAVHVDPGGMSQLHLLSTDGVGEGQVIPLGDSLFFTQPKFTSDENYVIAAARNGGGEMSLVRIDIRDGKLTNLLPWSMHVIGFPLVQGDTISFTASVAGNDRLYALAGNRLYRVDTERENVSTGNYQVSLLGGKAGWSGFSAAGYRLLVNEARLIPEDMTSFAATLPVLGADALAQHNTAFLYNVPEFTDTVTKYRKSHDLLNLHSFRPYFNEPDFRFSLIGENVLNTFVTELFFNYNSNERSKSFGANVNYGGLFPWIRGGVDYTVDRSTRVSGNRVYWNEAEANLGLAVPLNLAKGRFNRRLTIASDYVINQRTFKGAYKDSFDNRSFGYLRSSISFTNQLPQARMQIYPRLAQSVLVSYSKSVSSLEASQFLASAYWYLPGIAKTHSVVINTAFQARDTLRNASFSNSFPFSRGYLAENYHHMFKLGVNYHMPLVYPDWGIAGIIYFQRIRANVFYDFTRVNDYSRTGRFVAGNFTSVGTELFFDTKWWNQEPVSFGIRYSHLLDAGLQGISRHQWAFILPLNLF